MLNENTPILIGVGQITEKNTDLEQASTPIDLIEAAVLEAAADAGINPSLLSQLDELVLVRGFREPTQNSPAALANRLGAQQAVQWLTPNGGNAPQYLVNRYSESIAAGENKFVLFAGAEAMSSGRNYHKAGLKDRWIEKCDERDFEGGDSDPAYLYPDREMSSAHEQAQGIWAPAHVYPLFENALRNHYGRSIEEHQQQMGELFAPFSEVAAQSEHAWYPTVRSADEIATATESNRYVGWPYTKYMNAMNQINQSAALLLTSVAYAREIGVAEDKWIFLHGCADTTEKWHVTERVNYHSSPAIRVLGEQTFAMAGKVVADMDFVDIYSCFPSAVQIARDELGISADDNIPLTITGGLPFHGGAGNNYVMNSIAAMVAKLRSNRGKFGLVTANGGYLSKHSAGIYSTTPTEGNWQRVAPASYQSEIDDLPNPELIESPEGEATIETYTVVFGRDNKPQMGIVIARLGDGSDPAAPRCLAYISGDKKLLMAMTQECYIGRVGTVAKRKEVNVFSPN